MPAEQMSEQVQRCVRRVSGEAVAMGVAWLGMDALLHLRLRPWELLALWGVWTAAAVLGAVGETRWPRQAWLGRSLAIAVPLVACAYLNPLLRYPLSLAAIVYAAELCAGLRLLWFLWNRGVVDRPWSEWTRRVVLVAATVWATWPLFTDLLVGGVDARWYAFMLTDFIEQARAGVFPVFLGQGEYAYNGAAHLFRSAPLYMWVAGVWDVLTARSLSVLALQHLTAITAALAGVLALYHGLLRLAPEQRWMALLISILYLFCPGVLAPLYSADMYMTFMTVPCLALVMTGNAAVLLRADGSGWKQLGVGLALTWMAHPPTAMLASLTTLVVQVMSWAASGESLFVYLGKAVRGGLWFVGLAAYYFACMSEMPPRPLGSMRPDVLAVLGVALGFVAGVRGVLLQDLRWAAASVFALGLIAVGERVWLIWLVMFLVLCVVRARVFPRAEAIDGTRARAEGILLGLLALAVAWPLARMLGFEPNSGTTHLLHVYSQGALKALLPVSEAVQATWDFQPGYGIWFLFLCGLVAVWRRNHPAFILAAACLLILAMLFRIPAVSDFVVGYAPMRISNIISLPLALRLLPTVAACAAVSGFLALIVWKGRIQGAAMLVLACAVLWSSFETRKFVARGEFATLNRRLSSRTFMPENVVLERFAYDLLPMPEYYSNGITDPRLASRLLDRQRQVVVDADQIAAVMETGGTETIELTASQNGPDWMKLHPNVHVSPGQTRLLRFAWHSTINYKGYLIGRSLFHDYREYELPSSGLPGAFGTTERASKVLSLWNTGDYAIFYDWSHFLKPGHTIAEGPYATVTMSDYNPERSPIQMKSFIPFRAQVRAPVDGYLETPRVYLPGYRAWVDGKPAAVQESQQRLAMVPVSAGEHHVEVRYVGTWRVWLGFVVSAAAWLALLRPWTWRQRLSVLT